MAADSNSIIKNLYSKFKYGDIVIRLLYLNIGVSDNLTVWVDMHLI